MTTRLAIVLALGSMGLGCGDKKDSAPEAKPAKDASATSKTKGAGMGSHYEVRGGDSPGLLTAGTKAPNFTTVAHDGTKLELAKLRGKPVVLYFYPKDDTPGCTAEAESFRDGMFDFGRYDTTIIGVSLDTIESHKKFAHKYKLSFPLVADTKHEIADKYGVATRNGFAERVTFVIDRDGVIAKVFPRVVVTGHAKRVLEAVSRLPKPTKRDAPKGGKKPKKG